MQEKGRHATFTAEVVPILLRQLPERGRRARFIPGRPVWAADEYGAPGDCVVGAIIAGVTRVADAMLALGVI